MTAEQLKELLQKYDQGRHSARDQLETMAVPLARRVLAAEKLSQAVDAALTANGEWDTVSVLNDAYREASK